MSQNSSAPKKERGYRLKEQPGKISSRDAEFRWQFDVPNIFSQTIQNSATLTFTFVDVQMHWAPFYTKSVSRVCINSEQISLHQNHWQQQICLTITALNEYFHFYFFSLWVESNVLLTESGFSQTHNIGQQCQYQRKTKNSSNKILPPMKTEPRPLINLWFQVQHSTSWANLSCST